MRYVSWVVVLGSVAWLVAGMLGVRPSQFTWPDLPDESVVGTTAPALKAAKHGTTGQADTEWTRVPYADIYPVLAALEQVKSLDRVSGSLTWSSRLPEVSTEDMEMFISDTEGKHVFKPGPDGQISLPVRADWRDSGLELVSNQPQGVNGEATTELTLKMDFALPPDTSVTYGWLWESATQMQTAIDLLPRAAFDSHQVQGLLVQFPPAAEASVTVFTQAREETLEPGPDGYVRLPMVSSLRDENPRVQFSEAPIGLGPWVP
jgi:hypothetical protein